MRKYQYELKIIDKVLSTMNLFLIISLSKEFLSNVIFTNFYEACMYYYHWGRSFPEGEGEGSLGKNIFIQKII